MMGPRQVAQGALFYELKLDGVAPEDHLLRLIDRFVELSGVRAHLAPFYSSTRRPSSKTDILWPASIVEGKQKYFDAPPDSA